MTVPVRVLAGRYRIDAVLGGGGTAVVYRAFDLQAGRGVAVKELRPQFARVAPMRRRFIREAEIAARLDYEGIVRVLGHGEQDGTAFLVMELVEGETLRQCLARLGGLGHFAARRIVALVAQALGHAHDRGVVHRDVKPENVFIAGPVFTDPAQIAQSDDLIARIKLGDFGQAGVTALASLTGTSSTWGTPEYMAPEVFSRAACDPRSDLYGLGVLLFELTTGRLPFVRSVALARLVARDGAVTVPSASAGPALDALIADLLAGPPQDRPSSTREVIERLVTPERPPLVVAIRCSGCGVRLPQQMPICLACGRELARFAHTTGGKFRLWLRTLADDAAVIGRLLDQLHAVGETHGVSFNFLVGNASEYSKEEKAASIALPALLISDLDEPTARGLERLFREQGLDVEACEGTPKKRLRLNRAQLVPTGLATVVLGAMMVDMMGTSPVAGGAIGAIALIFGGGAYLAVERKRKRNTNSLLRLRPALLAVPAADQVLAEAMATLARLRAPAVRELTADVVSSLYRLGHGAGRLSGGATVTAMPSPIGGQLLARLPDVMTRLTVLAERLDALDAALLGKSEADLLQTHARLERRAAQATAEQRREIEAERSDVAAALERRARMAEEHSALTATLCRLLAQIRRSCQDAEAVLGGQAVEAAALTTAAAELDGFLAAAPVKRLGPSGGPVEPVVAAD